MSTDASTASGAAAVTRPPDQRARRPFVGRRRGARLAGAGVLAAATLLTSACAAGQLAQTADEKNSIDGANASVGSIDIRAAALDAPVGQPYYLGGASAEMSVVIVNGGQRNDTLTSVSSPSVTSWGSYDTRQDASAVQAADSDAATEAASGTPVTTPSASSDESSDEASNDSSDEASDAAPSTGRSGRTSSASSSASPSPSATLPAATQSVQITAGNRISYGVPDSDHVLLLRVLKNPLYAGNSIQVTFTFARAGSVTFAVPVALTATPGTAEIPEPSDSASVPN